MNQKWGHNLENKFSITEDNGKYFKHQTSNIQNDPANISWVFARHFIAIRLTKHQSDHQTDSFHTTSY